jgi:hypothetical protein
MNKIHGILSFILVFIALLIGIVAMSFTSIFHVIIYAGVLLIAFGCVIYFYCGKSYRALSSVLAVETQTIIFHILDSDYN